MQRFGIIAVALLFVGWNNVSGAEKPLKGEVKEVKLYPQGVYLTLSVPVELRGGTEEEIVFPDLWYADPTTVELKLLPGATGVSYMMEAQQANHNRSEVIALQKINLQRRDTLSAQKARLEADSMVLAREIEFLTANAKQEVGSVSQLAETDKWMRERYAAVYELQRKNREARAALDREIGANESCIRQVKAWARQIMLIRVQANSPRTQRVVFELSYFARAAQWQPVYFFRFQSGTTTAELDYRATVQQWSRMDWNRVSATLSYGTPMQSLERSELSKLNVLYQPLMLRGKEITKIGVTRFGGMYVGEGEPQALDLGVSQEEAVATATQVEVSENDISYRLGRPLTLASSSDDRQIQQTVEIRRDMIPVSYEYEVTPKINRNVLLLARIPEWQKLNLTDGRMNIFCDGRMLGQSNLSVRSTQDTLEVPIMLEPQVVVDRKEVGDYKEKASGAKMERSWAYRIRIKNNKAFPVNLTVKDQYPISKTDEVEVKLTDSSGAQVDPETGTLTWRLVLAPGEERTLTFAYTVRYPKGGTISF